MSFFIKPFEQTKEIQQALEANNQRIVVCYCAAWCRTCDSYLDAFQVLSEKFPEHVFLWVDIEDEESLLDDLDVENFPTILIQENGTNLFFGTMLPYIGHLERMIINTQDGQIIKSDEGPAPIAELLEEAAED
ncbi:MAG: thioredoxin family protein [Alcaligenaceae bacterium]|nr:thioredoxin family protein [Alcaligenaceae bacterium]